MMKQKIWKLVRPVVRPLGAVIIVALFYLLRVFPVKKNKVIATAFGGKRYGDNQKPMLEACMRYKKVFGNRQSIKFQKYKMQYEKTANKALF